MYIGSVISAASHSDRWFRVRPKFLLGSAAVAFVALFPLAAGDHYILKATLLVCAAIAILVGWYFLIDDGIPTPRWRGLVAFATSVYLTVSLPVFLFELSQIKWLVFSPMHHWISMYVSLWVRHGYNGFIHVLLGVIGSFFGHGTARTAFVAGSIILLTLRLSSGTWVY